MKSKNTHIKNMFLAETLIKPCLSISILLLLPIVLSNNDLSILEISNEMESHFYFGCLFTVASIPLLAFPLSEIIYCMCENSMINLKKSSQWSILLGASFTGLGLVLILFSISGALIWVLATSLVLALLLNPKSIFEGS